MNVKKKKKLKYNHVLNIYQNNILKLWNQKQI